MARNILKAVGVLVAGIVILLVVGWLVFVPSAKENSYAFVAAWGAKGSQPGKFHDPTGIAISNGEIFVSDARNSRIQVFDRNGTFKRQFGKWGTGTGELGRPMNLAVSGSELFIADYWNDRLSVFDIDGTPKRIIGRAGSGPGEFNSPGGVAIAPNGQIYVADFLNQRIQQLSRDGRFLRQFGTTGKVGIWQGQFNYPTDVAFAPNGTLFVADGYNDRIQTFDPSGDFSHKWGGPFGLNIYGPFKGWFATVTSLAVGPNGNVFVADFYNHRIQKFSADGTFLTSFGERGLGPGQFEYPIAVDVIADGTVFVVDYANNRIQKWRPASHR